VQSLLARRNGCAESELDAIDAEIVGRTYWYVLEPDRIARDAIDHWGWSLRRPLTVDQATVVLAAIGEAGYPLAINGAPAYPSGDTYGPYGQYVPVRGRAREQVIWDAARYWARRAADPDAYTYVSLGDRRGFLPRPVQYDQPGGMHPGQKAALTLGPERNEYMRSHTRLLLVVDGDGEP
jgi:hypothetical protein